MADIRAQLAAVIDPEAALQEIEANGEIAVTIGDVVVSHSCGTLFAMIAWCGRDARDAKPICIVAPRGDGQSTGTSMTGLRYVGWIEEFTDAELADGGLTDAEIDAAPETGAHAYALNGSLWRKFEQPYWDWFRNPPVAVPATPEQAETQQTEDRP